MHNLKVHIDFFYWKRFLEQVGFRALIECSTTPYSQELFQSHTEDKEFIEFSDFMWCKEFSWHDSTFFKLLSW